MTDVVMPQMGESIVEGTLTKWLKKPGDKVERDEPLFEISTDKVDTEIPSPAAGRLAEVLVQEGQTVQVNAVVARIDEGGAAQPRPRRRLQPQPPRRRTRRRAAAAPPQPRRSTAAAARARRRTLLQRQPAPQRPLRAEAAEEPAGPLSPLVRKMARENNIDLSKVTGTGAGGRITKEDVECLPEAQPRRRARAGCPAAPRPAAPAPHRAAALRRPSARPSPPRKRASSP